MSYKIQYEIFWDEFCQWPRTLVHQRVTYELYDFYLSDPSKWITRVLLKDSIVRPSTNWRFQTSFTSNVRIFISSSRNTVYRTIDGWENILKVRYEPDTRYKRVGIALLGIQIGKVARRASSRWNRSMDVILVPVNYQPWCTVLSGGGKMNDVIHPHGSCMEHRDKRLACKFFLAANGLLSSVHVFRKCLLESFEFSIFAFYF